MSKVTTLTMQYQESVTFEVKAFRVLFVMFMLLIGTYLFFVGHITFSVIARKSFEDEVRTAKSTVGELELTYLNAKNAITLDYARTLGYTETTAIQFASVDSNTVGFNR